MRPLKIKERERREKKKGCVLPLQKAVHTKKLENSEQSGVTAQVGSHLLQSAFTLETDLVKRKTELFGRNEACLASICNQTFYDEPD